MQHWFDGHITEICLDAAGSPQAWISCPPGGLPSPGQYLLAWSPAEPAAPLVETLFPAGLEQGSFLVAPPIPPSWRPGTALRLRGPLGRGFQLPGRARRLALASLLSSPACLLPLARHFLELGGEVALFCEGVLPALPAAVEVAPLAALPGALAWADCLALDTPLEALAHLPALLQLPEEGYPPCPAQVLVHTAMPCGGIGQCGVCAVPARRNWKLACEDGPVFAWRDLFG